MQQRGTGDGGAAEALAESGQGLQGPPWAVNGLGKGPGTRATTPAHVQVVVAVEKRSRSQQRGFRESRYSKQCQKCHFSIIRMRW